MEDKFYKKLIKEINRYAYLNNERVAMNIEKELDFRTKIQLTHNQHHIVLKIYHEGPVQISTVQKIFSLPSSNATRLANELVMKGLCKKGKLPDKKGIFLSLDTAGVRFVEERNTRTKKFTQDFFSTYLTSEELQELLENITRINETLSKLPEPPKGNT